MQLHCTMFPQPWIFLIATIFATSLFMSSLVESFPEADKVKSLPEQSPLVLWLNGACSGSFNCLVASAGPDCTSVGVGAFTEHGPFVTNQGEAIEKNQYSWNKEANILYLESPAGVGFSYSLNFPFYKTLNNEVTARDSLVFLQRWFAKFPEYKNRDFYIMGESYGGNPLLDFDTDMNAVDEYYWSHGIITDYAYKIMTSLCNSSRVLREYFGGQISKDCVLLQLKKSQKCILLQLSLTHSMLLGRNAGFLREMLNSGMFQFKKSHNVLQTEEPDQQVDECNLKYSEMYLNRKDVQKALHARLDYDPLNREIPTINVVGFFVLVVIINLNEVYTGDQDSVIPCMGTRRLVDRLAKTLGLKTTVPYSSWFVDKQVGGWTQVYGNHLTYATVRGASHGTPVTQGHMAPCLKLVPLPSTRVVPFHPIKRDYRPDELLCGGVPSWAAEDRSQTVSPGLGWSHADKISNLPGQPQVEFQQYSGYVTVDDQHQRALFYYFVEAEEDPASKPLVLWLNGGPGCSSIGVGAFAEHGPFRPSDNNVLQQNDYSWNKVANVLYLESPAGVGFSYSSNKSFYASVTDEITARDNLVFLQRWFTKFPEYSNNDFFITGESYGGHYVPQLSQLIVQTKTNFNLKGIAIGNPLLEFNTDFNSRSEYFWSHGLISDSTYEVLTRVCNFSSIRRQIQNGNLRGVCVKANKLLNTEISNFIDKYDVTLDVCLSSVNQQAYVLNQLQETQKIDVCIGDKTTTYLNRKQVQKALHANLVGVTKWSTCSSVLHYDYQNLEIPTIPILGSLVKSGIKVLVYSGDQDSVIPLIGSRSLVNGLAKEIGLDTTVAYRAWFEGKQVAGWTKVYGNILSYATIRGASHEAPFSQPQRSLLLLKAFLEGKPLPGSLVNSSIRVLVYSGDQDSVIPLLGSRSLVNGLAKQLGLNTTVAYRAWFEGKQVGGWTQVYGDILSYATIRGASHEAPYTQPERSLGLLKAFLEGKPLPTDKISNLPGQPHVKFQQYSGYFSVDNQNQRALFYYFVEAEKHPTSKPVVLWLNGGPGCSSIGVGALVEHGPFKPDSNVLVKNHFSWNKVANVLYLESPAGVGFSYSSNASFYTLVTDEITARDNLVFLQRWFTEFPEYSNNDFFITGESYAGHYAPQLAQLIVQTKTNFNLKGIAIGNPLMEFDTDLNSKAEFLWSHGLISDSTYDLFTRVCNYSTIRRQTIHGNLSDVCAKINGLVFTEVSNYIDQYDVTLDVCLSSANQQSYELNQMQETQKIDVCVDDKAVTYLNRKDVQKALHAKLVGVSKWSTCSSGDQDSVIPLLGSRSLVNGLAKELGLNTTVAYRAWFEGKQVAGWTQVYGGMLSYATIRGASHEAPFTQPQRSLVLLKAFLEGKPLPGVK
ncbi:Serine carboxypeptidase-like 45 [Glycine soja]